ncbi:iron chelate uptake ABC transporter family permease subunit, partial [Wohlfahrtiimonas chitiniclastica]
MALYLSKRLGLIVFVILLLGVTILIGTSIGEIYIPFDVVLKTIANKLWDAGYPLDRIDEGIVWNYRLSRTVIAALCGMALALSGTILQALLRNMLADPYLLGISAGASTGAVAVVVLGIGAGALSVSFGAFFGAITAFILVALLAFRTGKGNGG